jgi:uncharacterized PurR-regulated membrane protein YhhQ (DUF165 family)
MSARSAAWLTAYILSIVVANWMTATLGLVPIGFGLMVTAGTFAAGAALLLRDGVQQSAGRWWALAAIGIGAVVSVVTSTPAIAVASGIAFAVSELVDMGVFTPLRKRSLALAVLASSVVSAPVDTVLFLSIAGFGVTWQAVVGQFLVKTAIALAVSAVITCRRDLSRR